MEPGLCGACGHAERIAAPRSTFVLCGRWRAEPGRFRRYPALPVLACPGFAAGPGQGP